MDALPEAKHPPLVTAVVPAHNSENFIRQALDSLAFQTWKNLEILVGDDASTDSTLAIVRDFAASHPNARVVARETNLGWLANTNDLMSRASGDLMFLAFHDDTVRPTYVEKLVQALCQEPQAILAFSDLELVQLDGSRSQCAFAELDGVRTRLGRGLAMAHRPANWWVAIHGVFRASAFRDIGGLRPNDAGEYRADWPWMMHMSLLGEFVRIPEVLCTKIYQEGSLSLTWEGRRETQQALRRACVCEVRRSPLSRGEQWILVGELRRTIAVPPAIRSMAKRVVRRVFR